MINAVLYVKGINTSHVSSLHMYIATTFKVTILFNIKFNELSSVTNDIFDHLQLLRFGVNDAVMKL